MASAIPHPYYPLHIQPKDYVPNEHGVLALVSLFGAGCSVILGLTLLAISKYAPRLKPADRIAVLWFMLSAFDSLPVYSFRCKHDAICYADG